MDMALDEKAGEMRRNANEMDKKNAEIMKNEVESMLKQLGNGL